MAHSRPTALEIQTEYVDTMSKIYYSYFKDYHNKLMKLQVCKPCGPKLGICPPKIWE